MIEESSRNAFQGVLVYQLDRFARNRTDSAIYKLKLRKNGVRVFSANENISEDASGILMEAFLEGVAEYYSVELSQKVKRGMNINASKCLWNGGNIPLGYYIDDTKHYQIKDDDAIIVKKIFEMYSNGTIMADIIRYLNTRSIRTSNNNEFNKNSITRILNNNKYIGIYSYSDIEIKDGIPAIISQDLFDKVQEIMKKNKQAPARARAKVEYLLTTKLFCGHCKSMMTGISGTSKTGKSHSYYACNNSKKKLCNKKNIKKDYIENLVVSNTRNILNNENIDNIAKIIVDLSKKEKDSSSIKRLNKSLKDNERQKLNLLDSLKICEIDSVRKSIFEEISKLDSQHTDLEKEILLEEKQNNILTIPQIKFFLSQMKNGNINDIKYRRLLITTFINKIYLYDDKLILILNTQNEPVEITISLLEDIESSFIESNGSPIIL